MKCERCKTVDLVNLGMTACTTGDADRMGCGVCKGIWFRQKNHASEAGWTPLRVSIAKILNLARAETLWANVPAAQMTGKRAAGADPVIGAPAKPAEEYYRL